MEILYLIITLLVGVAIGVTIENYRLLQIEKLTEPCVQMPILPLPRKDTIVVKSKFKTRLPRHEFEIEDIKFNLVSAMNKELINYMEIETYRDPMDLEYICCGKLEIIKGVTND